MSDTVDLMVVGMAEELSAEELSARLVKEFNQPADAFDALVSAATGAGPAYAAQSNVELDVAVEGKDKLESLGVVCSIPGVTDQPSANQATISDESASTDVSVADESPSDDGDDAIDLSDFADSEFDLSAVADEDESMSAFDVESDNEQPTAEKAAPESAADDEDGGFDFADELEALGTGAELSDSVATEEISDEASSEPADQLVFDDALDDLQSLGDNMASETQVDEDKELDNAVEIDISGPEPEESGLEEFGAGIDDDALSDNNNSDESTAEQKASAMDIALEDIALSDDEDTPLTRPRESSNVELDDGGLSLAADDNIAPIKTSATDVPAALANRSPADVGEELSLSLDDAPVGAGSSDGKNTAAGLSAAEPENDVSELAAGPEELPVELPEANAEEQSDQVTVVEDMEAVPASVDSELDAESPQTEEAVEQLEVNDVSDDSSDSEELENETAIDSEDISDDVEESKSESVDNVVAELSADAATTEDAGSTDTLRDDSSTAEVADTTASSKSIAEELIESLQGNDTSSSMGTDAVAPLPAASVASTQSADFVSDGEEEQLRKSREQVAVLQGKIEEDLVEEEQVYQEFEQIAKKRTLQKVATGAAAAAVIGVIGGGVYFSGMLTPAPEAAAPVVVAAVPKPDREQESLNAAIERSATLINPETLSTEELLVTLAQGSAQDSLGDLRRYILGASSRAADDAQNDSNIPRAGAAIPADSNSMKLLKNRVPHSGDKYFDEWSRREIDLRLYIELVDRLIDAGDIVAATELCNRTKDNLFAVMGKQSVARAYKKEGNRAEALKLLEMASRNTYSIASATERVVAMADYAYSEHVIGQREDALDSYLSVSILAASLNRSEYKTIGHATVSDYLMRAGLESQSRKQLDRAIGASLELPSNSAARDLALRHIALTEAQMGLFEQAIKHTEQIIDPFASVSAFHGIALEYESIKDYAMATEVIQKAFDASSVIEDKEKRRQLLSKIQLANSD